MGTYQLNCNGDYRNEGWSLSGSGVTQVYHAFSAADDTKYASCPGTKGRATVSFPIDTSSGNIPDGSIITSVTVFIRVKKTVSDNKSVTVNVLSTDDTSKYFSRTVYPTTTFTTYEVGTYTVDPTNKSWTKDRVNRLLAQVFSYSVPPNDGVRVSQLYCVINYKVRPTLSITSPSGTVTSATPTVTWAYTHSDGDFQKAAEYKIFTAAQAAVATFNAATSTASYSGTITGDITSFTLPTSLAPDAYYIYARVQSIFGAWSPWTGRSFTVTGASPGAPGGASFGGVGTGGAGGFESVIADPVTSNAYLTLRDGSNLLGVQTADFETLTDAHNYSATNATLTQDTTLAYNIGAGSLKMVAASAANMAATTSWIEVAPNTSVTFRCQTLAKTVGRTVSMFVLFSDENFVSLGGTISTSGTDSTSTWTEIVGTGTTPDTSGSRIMAQVQIQVVAPGNAEQHNIDDIGLMYGTNSAWSHGGHMSHNLLSAIASNADDPTVAQTEPYSAQTGTTYNGRVTSTGTGSDGSKMFKTTYAGLSPTVSVVAVGTVDSQTSNGSGYTLNKPVGVADGDLLVAYVGTDAGTVASPPSGWTLVDTVDSGGGLRANLSVLMRDGLAADPSTWVGNVNTSGGRRVSRVVAYRGAASTSTQLAVEDVSTSLSGSLNQRTPILNNTDPNAWRLTAFVFRDDVTGGSSVANTQPASVIPPISYVGRGGNWWSGAAQTTYQINKPSGVVSGDLMLAFGAFGGTATPTAPTGWTQVTRQVKTTGDGTDHSGTSTFVVWKRTAGGSEPSSWTASYTGTGTPLMTQALAYRNCDTDTAQFIATGVSSTSSTYQLDTATVTNTDSRAWRVCGWMFTTPYGDTTNTTEVTKRADNSSDVGNHPDVTLCLADSNGPVSTGAHKRNAATQQADPWSMVSFIALLKPLPSAPASGANETERLDNTAFTADGLGGLTLAAYDTNGVAPTGSQSVYGIFTPGSGTSINASSAWEGFLTPATATTAGEVGATLASYVDISAVPSDVTDRVGSQVTVTASFLGSTGGTPYLKLYSYNANELLSLQVQAGNPFNTTTWTKSSATYTVPSGATRFKIGLAASDRTVADWVAYDRVSLAFGDSDVYRVGTGRTNHPIYSVPSIEYQDDLGDGYGDWVVLPGSVNALLKYDNLTGLVTYTDQTLTPNSHRRYRARTVSYGLLGETFLSGYGAVSDEITLVAQEWWLKDATDENNAIKLKVSADPLKVITANTATVYQPLGADLPIVLTEGYKGDAFTIKVQVSGAAAYKTLRAMLKSGKTLFLQSNLDNAWWVRPVSDLPSETQLTGDMWTNPLRFIDLSFVEVDSE